MNRRLIAVSLTSLVLATACTGPGKPQGAVSSKVKLRYLRHIYQPAVDEVTRLIAEYQKLHPNVTIEQVPVPSEQLVAKADAGLASGDVDVVALEAPLASYYASRKVAAVDFAALGFRSRDDYAAKFIDHGLDPFTYKGTLYAVPAEGDCLALYINKALFRQAGIDAATEYPRTWEDVLALSQRLTRRDRLGRITRAGFDFTYPSGGSDDPPTLELNAMIAQKGGSILTPDGTRSTFDSAASVAVFRFIKDWVYRYRLGDPMAGPSYARFLDGKVAMTTRGPWVARLLKDRSPAIYKELLVVPFPAFEDAVAPFGAPMDAYGLMVNARSSAEEQREAWKFIAFLTRDPIGHFKAVGAFVPRKEVFERASEIEASFKFATVFLDMVKRPQMQLWEIPEAAAINKAIEEALLSMATENRTPEQAVAAAGRKIQAILDAPG